MTTDIVVEGAAPDRDLSARDVRQLEEGVDGVLLRPSAAGYDTARRVFNAMIDRRPALIVRCAGAEDVIRGVAFARAHGLPVTVKGGGHNVAGNAVADGALMLDTSAMKGVGVDAESRVVTVQAGLTLGDLDRATQAAGLATPTGVMSGTGLSGLALGGGLGWLNGMHGLTCDNLVAAELVTADAELIAVSEQEHADLLWGLRGGGGNFGVVTSFTFELHPVREVLAGALTYPARKARDALRLYHEFASECPDELSANASLSRTPEGDTSVSISVCHAGLLAHGRRLLHPLRRLGPELALVEPMSYLALQKAPDEWYPSGRRHYWKSGFVTAVTDELIDVLLEYVARMPSEASGVGLQQLHGAAARVEPTATAYPHRGTRYDLLILSQWPDDAQSERNISWTRELFDAIAPHLAAGVYVNNLGAEGEDRVRQAYGANYDRMVALKTEYDPANLFRHNQNVRPMPQGSTSPRRIA